MFIYSVYYYDEIDKKMATDKGLVSAATFEEATGKVVNDLYDGVVGVAIYAFETSEAGYATFSDIEGFLKNVEIIIKEKDT